MNRHQMKAACAATLMRAVGAVEFPHVRGTNAIGALGDPVKYQSCCLEEAFRVQ
jgi:hypothetical protein